MKFLGLVQFYKQGIYEYFEVGYVNSELPIYLSHEPMKRCIQMYKDIEYRIGKHSKNI